MPPNTCAAISVWVLNVQKILNSTKLGTGATNFHYTSYSISTRVTLITFSRLQRRDIMSKGPRKSSAIQEVMYKCKIVIYDVYVVTEIFWKPLTTFLTLVIEMNVTFFDFTICILTTHRYMVYHYYSYAKTKRVTVSEGLNGRCLEICEIREYNKKFRKRILWIRKSGMSKI